MAGSNKDMFLWWGSGSAPCWRVMLVLAEKGLWDGLPQEQITFSEKGHKQPAIMKLNSRGQVPTFKDGSTVVNESGAICMYLTDKYRDQGTKLMPEDPVDRAQVYQVVFEVDNLKANVMEPLVIYKFRTPKEKWDTDLLKEKLETAKEEVERWNKLLSGRDYVACNSFTVADAFFFPFLAFMVRVGMDMTSRPALKKYYDRVMSRPSVDATWPPHWREDKPAPKLLEGL